MGSNMVIKQIMQKYFVYVSIKTSENKIRIILKSHGTVE